MPPICPQQACASGLTIDLPKGRGDWKAGVYDVEVTTELVKALAAFSATLRNEVDLDQLREQLVAVVEETMQPAHISLWVPHLVPSRELNTRRLPRIDEEERQLL